MKYPFGFIVEGTHDEWAIRSVLGNDFPIVILHGDGLSSHLQKLIAKANEDCEVLFIATDPDDAGNRIAEKIQALFNLPRIDLDAEECSAYRGKKKRKIGLEHASDIYLKEVLTRAFIKEGLL